MERKLVISSQLANINEVRTFLDGIFTESGVERKYFNRVFLGVSEVVNNSIVHGNGENTGKKVSIQVRYSNYVMSVKVEDEGKGFQFEQVEDPTCFQNLKKESGRGIFLVRQLADEVVFLEGGCKVLIKFRLMQ